jgi:cytochrome P450
VKRIFENIADISAQTVAAMSTFFLAMILYPDIQAAAQRELDAVIGLDRLPDFSDRGSLPYIDAIVKEVHR